MAPRKCSRRRFATKLCHPTLAEARLTPQPREAGFDDERLFS